MLDLCLLGTGGMMPLPNRWLTSLITRLNGSSLLIDCGEGTQIAMKESGWSPHSIDTIMFTHYHGDHISGLPGLLLSMGNSDRSEPVLLIGPKGLERVVSSLRVIAPELPFELEFHEISGNEERIEKNGYVINTFKVNHNILCYGYTLEVERNGRFIPEKAEENGIPLRYWSRLQKGEVIEADGRIMTPDMILGPKRQGIKVTYCTDTRPTEGIISHAENSDLFICEGMYGEPDMEDKAAVHKHMTFYEAAELAKRANAKELWLTHYSPSLVRPEQYENKVRGIFPNSYVCKDGRTATLEFDKNE